MQTTADTATARQIAFIDSLRSERGLEPFEGFLTKSQASRAIDHLLSLPKVNRNHGGRVALHEQAGMGHLAEVPASPAPVERKAAPDADLTAGVYETAEGIFIVKPNKEGTRLYAKQMVESAERATEAGTRVECDFIYAPGAIYRLSEADRMPLDRAKALTVRYGRCICCGRRLKAAESVEQGIGPVCIKRFAA